MRGEKKPLKHHFKTFKQIRRTFSLQARLSERFKVFTKITPRDFGNVRMNNYQTNSRIITFKDLVLVLDRIQGFLDLLSLGVGHGKRSERVQAAIRCSFLGREI